MSYVAPNSDIILLQNIKLDSAYENTIWFSSKSAQESYFFNRSKVVAHLTNHMYNRTMKNSIKVKLAVGTIEHCTYLAFKNTSFENKWFYCFIDDFNYINDNTTEIIYHVDELQTYFIGECSLQQCYVLREHAMDDTVGANRVPEPMGSDRVLYKLKWECPDMDDYSVVISASMTDPTEQSGKALWQGMFHGLEIKDIMLEDATSADIIMNELAEMLGDGNYIDPALGTDRQQVVSIIMFPTMFCSEDSDSSHESLPHKESYTIPVSRTTVDGYTPKNNKLFTAPYKSLLLTNGIGGAVTLDYDDFREYNNTITFDVVGFCGGSGEMICFPRNYKIDQNTLDDFKLVISGFPQCAYTLDAYRAWVAGGGEKYQKLGLIQGIADGLFGGIKAGFNATAIGQNVSNAYEDAASTISAGSPIQKTVDAYTQAERMNRMGEIRTLGGYSGIAGGLANTGINYMSTEFQKGNMVNVPVGSQSASVMVASRELKFRCYELNIINQDARRIDDFFSMYGYQTNKIKVPNINGRPQWNYVQTQGCVVSGNVPASIRTRIAQIFDSGVRFWNNGDNIGNYSLANK